MSKNEVKTVRIFWSIFWGFLLSCMVTYVVSNMNGAEFDITKAIILTIAFTLTAILLGDGLLKEEAE